MIDDLWYKNAIVYCLDVEKYVDSNGDGMGTSSGSGVGSITWPAWVLPASGCSRSTHLPTAITGMTSRTTTGYTRSTGPWATSSSS